MGGQTCQQIFIFVATGKDPAKWVKFDYAAILFKFY